MAFEICKPQQMLMKIFMLGTILVELSVVCFPTIITSICFSTSSVLHPHVSSRIQETLSLG